MGTWVTADRMTSTVTEHYALRWPDGWQLSWLPTRRVSLNQALTGMALVESLARRPAVGDPMWLHIRNWMAELAITNAELPTTTEPSMAGER